MFWDSRKGDMPIPGPWDSDMFPPFLAQDGEPSSTCGVLPGCATDVFYGKNRWFQETAPGLLISWILVKAKANSQERNCKKPTATVNSPLFGDLFGPKSRHSQSPSRSKPWGFGEARDPFMTQLPALAPVLSMSTMATYLASEEGRARRAGISDRWKVVALEVFLLIADIAVGCVPLFWMKLWMYLFFPWLLDGLTAKIWGDHPEMDAVIVGYELPERAMERERLLVTCCYVSMLYNSGIV